MAIKDAIYQVDNGSGFDEIHFKTKAKQVICQNGKTAEQVLSEKGTKRGALHSINGWERDYDTGMIEQWGYGYCAGTNGNIITLPISYSDNNYSIILTPYYTGANIPKIKVVGVTNVNFTVTTDVETYFYWRILGW